MKKSIIFGCSFIFLGSFFLNFSNRSEPLISSFDTKPISHDIFNALLQKHVDASTGMVNYKGFIADSAKLNSYFKLLEANPPTNSTWTKPEQLAYWINAYNAYTLRLMIRNYPLKSIKDLGGKVPFVNSIWDYKFITIGNKKYDLNNIEHSIIRKQFPDEPRIHFAVNCASFSCPILRNEAYTAAKIDQQLQDQASKFINDGIRNKISVDKPQLSKIFLWYKTDFTKKMTLTAFINQFSKTKISPKATISHLDYLWSLNEQ